jgi:hypothetical protein
MPNFQPVQSTVRALRVAGLVAFGLWQSVSGATVSPSASVAAVQSTRVADLVLLDHGFNAGLRQGMVCRVTRGTTEIAEVLLVDLRPTCSSALILSVVAKQAIRAGDTAAIKILKT